MSEHQIYDFRCIDKSLTKKQQDQLRKISSRAQITSRRFYNEYSYGDLKGDPKQMLASYFDAHFYLTNWGSRVLMFKFLAKLVPLERLQIYCDGEYISAYKKGQYTILIFDAMEGELDEYWEFESALDELIDLRAMILNGDDRALYAMWLHQCVHGDEWYNDGQARPTHSPPVPANLDDLGSTLRLFVRLFDLDQDLIHAASHFGPQAQDSNQSLHELIQSLNNAEQKTLLLRVAQGDQNVGAELQKRAREQNEQEISTPSLKAIEEKALELKRKKNQRARAAAAKKKREQERQAQAAREKRLETLRRNWDTLWIEVDSTIKGFTRKDYTKAATLIVDMMDAADTPERQAYVVERIEHYRQLYARRRALLEEFNNKGL